MARKPPRALARAKSPSEIEVIARAVVQSGPSVLLCRNRKGGYWYLPGGHVEPGEAAAAALSREMEEELGVQVRVGELMLVSEGLFVQGARSRHELNLVFHVEPADRKALSDSVGPQSREEAIDFAWVELARIVELDVRPEAVKAWLISPPPRATAAWLGAADAAGAV
jgi:ADP-ribose pyrophosphatase YjhB (NUDIX family)